MAYETKPLFSCIFTFKLVLERGITVGALGATASVGVADVQTI